MTNAKAIRQDERILAAIIAAHQRTKRPLLSAIVSGEGFISRRADGPCCAVGMGVLYAIPPPRRYTDFIQAFAGVHRVSEDYAEALSDAFELPTSCDVAYDPGSDRARGIAVGLAVRDYLLEG